MAYDLILVWIYIPALSVLVAAYLYISKTFKYFEKRGIPSEPATFPLGSLWPVFTLRKSYNNLLSDMYNKHKREKFVGFFQFWVKSVLIIDRDLIKDVLVNEFEYFSDKNIHHNRKLQPLTAHLFAVDGEEWKLLRTKMSPAFKPSNLKGMFETVVAVGHTLTDYVYKVSAENDVLECKDLFTRYGLAIIASTSFGLESDVFTDKSSKFFKMAYRLTSPSLRTLIHNTFMFCGKDVANMFNLRSIPKESHEFFFGLVKDTVEYRETQRKTRKDFLQLLIDLKNGVGINERGKKITFNEVAAQSYVFFLAGFEAISNTSSYFLYEMALNPEVQKKVQAEVDAVDEITYDSLATMKYFDMVIEEVLRKNPPLGFVGRVCSKDYKVPNTDHVIEKGTHVLVSAYGLQWDPELFPEPEKFIPERFSKENRDAIQPFSYLPFGEGPRLCIGKRFGELTIKTGLAVLLKDYEVRLCPKTTIPLQYAVTTFNTVVKGGIWLQFVKRGCET